MTTPLGGAGRCAPWMAVLALQLALVWAWPFFPSQDGATHVANAGAFRAAGTPGTRASEFFERRLDPFPNWTAHVVLAVLTTIVPEATADKLMASLCLVVFALGSWRLIQSSAGAEASALLTIVALLFSFSRVFWLGFYNCVLSIGAAFAVTAWQRRQRDGASLVLSMIAFSFLYLTHFSGWLLTLFLCAALAFVPFDVRRLARVALAAVPSLAMAAAFLFETGVLGSREARRALRATLASPATTPQSNGSWFATLATWPREWFGVQSPSWAWTLAVGAGVCICIVGFAARRESKDRDAARTALAAACAVVVLAFTFGPDDLGARGGFFKTRLAVVAPVLLLAAIGGPMTRRARLALAAVLAVTTAGELAATAGFIASANAELADFTAGIARVGKSRSLIFLRPKRDPARLVDYVNQALYCYGNGNVDVANYEAGTDHFPLRYRPGVREAVREMTNGTRPYWTDVVLAWDADPARVAPLSNDYDETFRTERLRVFTRRAPVGRP